MTSLDRLLEEKRSNRTIAARSAQAARQYFPIERIFDDY